MEVTSMEAHGSDVPPNAISCSGISKTLTYCQCVRQQGVHIVHSLQGHQHVLQQWHAYLLWLSYCLLKYICSFSEKICRDLAPRHIRNYL